MWGLHTANEGHWVPIATVASFKRMRDYESDGKEWLVEALRYSTELEVDKEGVNVRRRREVKEPKDSMSRSVYAVRISRYIHDLKPTNASERLWRGEAQYAEGPRGVLRAVW